MHPGDAERPSSPVDGLEEPGAGRSVCSFCFPAAGPARACGEPSAGGSVISRSAPTTRVNEQIRIPRIRVIDENGEQLGILETPEALTIARERGLDLVEVAPTARPPVCRIMDYGRYTYELSKKAKKARAKQHVQRVKMIKFRPKTEEHDYSFKKKHIVEFLDAGDKVKVVITFRGREMTHLELGERMVERLLDELESHAVVDDEPRLEGNNLSLMLSPRRKK
jgi:translation initiation factor IF-3